ncbi:papain-like cysteine protease family protein [Ensifer sp. ENS08]|uniref:papain-like cysteine protease family protein n=1 Tax=Ensifer sp. ENS08 TaxID=2769273 RepID=UPI00177CA963|nr:papain-like cysteine protease family protein [Ensifer sp. ENS08]MBD9571879.1 hypothetical protein [Ensifer sp. ENS08]
MRTVRNPPSLIPQETGSWCFAAAEAMVRAYYRLPTLSQYEIARASTEALSRTGTRITEQWEMARALDDSMGVAEDGGRNLNSNVVQLVRGQWNSFSQEVARAYFIKDPQWDDIRREIENDRILVVGNANHYFVVIGYSEEDGVQELLVLDPLPVGRGGNRSLLSFDELLSIEGHACIAFREDA